MQNQHITEDSGIPLIGCIAFGIIDRGTNLLQIRSTSICNMSCTFCSTDGGPNSTHHKTTYTVDAGYLLKWVKKVCELKGDNVEIFIDSVGDPLMYNEFVKLVAGLKKITNVKHVTVITNGTLLTDKMIKEIEDAGLDRINLSIHTMDEKIGKLLMGCSWYDISKIKEICRKIAKSKIELMLTPVWLPKVNDKDVEDIIQFSKDIGAKIGIQKYEIYKHSRKHKGAGKVNWFKFYRQIKEWEKKFGIKLTVNKDDVNVENRPRLKDEMHVDDKVNAEIRLPGWQKGQMIGVANNRCISINDCDTEIGKTIRVKITDDKNGIYLAEKC